MPHPKDNEILPKGTMKASELRIGNYIYHKGLLVRVQTIYHDDQFADYITEIKRDLNDAEGIPLTEEWLLKFGFRNETDLTFARSHTDSSYVLTHRSKGKFKDGGYFIGIRYDDWYVSETSHTEVHNFSFDVKYVHQLQNLYFALTGEELTVKQKSDPV